MAEEQSGCKIAEATGTSDIEQHELLTAEKNIKSPESPEATGHLNIEQHEFPTAEKKIKSPESSEATGALNIEQLDSTGNLNIEQHEFPTAEKKIKSQESSEATGILNTEQLDFLTAEKKIKSSESPEATGTLNIEQHEFLTPEKKIKSPLEVQEKWEKSEAYKDYLGFLQAMNDAVKNKKIRDEYPVSQVVSNFVSLLDELDKWVDEIAPIEQPQRFGNKAFRAWHEKLTANVEDLMRTALDEKFHKAVHEISVYLIESFGNATRIDYGTGHEMMFAAFLCCLYKIEAFIETDAVAVVLKLFFRYLLLVQKLQLTYRMEPAGSQGVWSLDDYQFIPFIWGSSQLLDHKRILPKSFPDPDISASFAKDYMFLTCIQHIFKVKTGPFAEHSNQLWNISAVKLWSKVNSGLIKMYKAEVLSKYPVMQHFLFGSLMKIDKAS